LERAPRTTKVPVALQIASSVLVLQCLLLSLSKQFADLVLSVGIALLFALLLFLGSRLGWVLLVVGAGVDMVARVSGEEPLWMLGLDGILIVALLLPPRWTLFGAVVPPGDPCCGG
jgi:hypothetical protein